MTETGHNKFISSRIEITENNGFKYFKESIPGEFSGIKYSGMTINFPMTIQGQEISILCSGFPVKHIRIHYNQYTMEHTYIYVEEIYNNRIINFLNFLNFVPGKADQPWVENYVDYLNHSNPLHKIRVFSPMGMKESISTL